MTTNEVTTNANTNRVSFADLPPEVREFIGNTASDFFMDNYPDGDDFDEDEEPPLENEQLRAIAEMTNERFGTDYNDDDIFDFLEEFEQELIQCDGVICW